MNGEGPRGEALDLAEKQRLYEMRNGRCASRFPHGRGGYRDDSNSRDRFLPPPPCTRDVPFRDMPRNEDFTNRGDVRWYRERTDQLPGRYPNTMSYVKSGSQYQGQHYSQENYFNETSSFPQKSRDGNQGYRQGNAYGPNPKDSRFNNYEHPQRGRGRERGAFRGGRGRGKFYSHNPPYGSKGSPDNLKYKNKNRKFDEFDARKYRYSKDIDDKPARSTVRSDSQSMSPADVNNKVENPGKENSHSSMVDQRKSQLGSRSSSERQSSGSGDRYRSGSAGGSSERDHSGSYHDKERKYYRKNSDSREYYGKDSRTSSDNYRQRDGRKYSSDGARKRSAERDRSTYNPKKLREDEEKSRKLKEYKERKFEQQKKKKTLSLNDRFSNIPRSNSEDSEIPDSERFVHTTRKENQESTKSQEPYSAEALDREQSSESKVHGTVSSLCDNISNKIKHSSEKCEDTENTKSNTDSEKDCERDSSDSENPSDKSGELEVVDVAEISGSLGSEENSKTSEEIDMELSEVSDSEIIVGNPLNEGDATNDSSALADKSAVMQTLVIEHVDTVKQRHSSKTENPQSEKTEETNICYVSNISDTDFSHPDHSSSSLGIPDISSMDSSLDKSGVSDRPEGHDVSHNAVDSEDSVKGVTENNAAESQDSGTYQSDLVDAENTDSYTAENSGDHTGHDQGKGEKETDSATMKDSITSNVQLFDVRHGNSEVLPSSNNSSELETSCTKPHEQLVEKEAKTLSETQCHKTAGEQSSLKDSLEEEQISDGKLSEPLEYNHNQHATECNSSEQTMTEGNNDKRQTNIGDSEKQQTSSCSKTNPSKDLESADKISELRSHSSEKPKNKLSLKRTHSQHLQEEELAIKRARHKTSEGTEFKRKKEKSRRESGQKSEKHSTDGKKELQNIDGIKEHTEERSGKEEEKQEACISSAYESELDDTLPRLCSPATSRLKRQAKKSTQLKEQSGTSDIDSDAPKESQKEVSDSHVKSVKERRISGTVQEKTKPKSVSRLFEAPADLFTPDPVAPNVRSDKSKKDDERKKAEEKLALAKAKVKNNMELSKTAKEVKIAKTAKGKVKVIEKDSSVEATDDSVQGKKNTSETVRKLKKSASVPKMDRMIGTSYEKHRQKSGETDSKKKHTQSSKSRKLSGKACPQVNGKKKVKDRNIFDICNFSESMELPKEKSSEKERKSASVEKTTGLGNTGLEPNKHAEQKVIQNNGITTHTCEEMEDAEQNEGIASQDKGKGPEETTNSACRTPQDHGSAIPTQLVTQMGESISIFGEKGVLVFESQTSNPEENDQGKMRGLSNQTAKEQDLIGEVSTDSEVDSEDGRLVEAADKVERECIEPGYNDYEDISSCEPEEGRLEIDLDARSHSEQSLNGSADKSLDLNNTLEKTVIYDGDNTVIYNGDKSHNESSDRTLPYTQEEEGNGVGNSPKETSPDADKLTSSQENLLEEVNSGDIKEFLFNKGVPQSPWTPAPATPAPPTPAPPTPAAHDSDMNDDVVDDTQEPADNSPYRTRNDTENDTTDEATHPPGAVNPELEILDMVDLRPSPITQTTLKTQQQNTATKEHVAGRTDPNTEDSLTLSQHTRNFDEVLKSIKQEIPDSLENSQSTETSSDYGTDSNRGTPCSDIGEDSNSVVIKKEIISDLDRSSDNHATAALSSKSANVESAVSPMKFGRSVSTDTGLKQVPVEGKSGSDLPKRRPSAMERRSIDPSEVAMLVYLRKLRQTNFSSSVPIAFTHIKTLKHGRTVNTIGYLDPQKFKETKLLIIQCQGCQHWFSCTDFFMHIDSDEEVSEESLWAEPWPTKSLNAADQDAWEKFLYIKKYFTAKKIPGSTEQMKPPVIPAQQQLTSETVDTRTSVTENTVSVAGTSTSAVERQVVTSVSNSTTSGSTMLAAAPLSKSGVSTKQSVVAQSLITTTVTSTPGLLSMPVLIGTTPTSLAPSEPVFASSVPTHPPPETVSIGSSYPSRNEEERLTTVLGTLQKAPLNSSSVPSRKSISPRRIVPKLTTGSQQPMNQTPASQQPMNHTPAIQQQMNQTPASQQTMNQTSASQQPMHQPIANHQSYQSSVSQLAVHHISASQQSMNQTSNQQSMQQIFAPALSTAHQRQHTQKQISPPPFQRQSSNSSMTYPLNNSMSSSLIRSVASVHTGGTSHVSADQVAQPRSFVIGHYGATSLPPPPSYQPPLQRFANPPPPSTYPAPRLQNPATQSTPYSSQPYRALQQAANINIQNPDPWADAHQGMLNTQQTHPQRAASTMPQMAAHQQVQTLHGPHPYGSQLNNGQSVSLRELPLTRMNKPDMNHSQDARFFQPPTSVQENILGNFGLEARKRQLELEKQKQALAKQKEDQIEERRQQHARLLQQQLHEKNQREQMEREQEYEQQRLREQLKKQVAQMSHVPGDTDRMTANTTSSMHSAEPRTGMKLPVDLSIVNEPVSVDLAQTSDYNNRTVLNCSRSASSNQTNVNVVPVVENNAQNQNNQDLILDRYSQNSAQSRQPCTVPSRERQPSLHDADRTSSASLQQVEVHNEESSSGAIQSDIVDTSEARTDGTEQSRNKEDLMDTSLSSSSDDVDGDPVGIQRTTNTETITASSRGSVLTQGESNTDAESPGKTTARQDGNSVKDFANHHVADREHSEPLPSTSSDSVKCSAEGRTSSKESRGFDMETLLSHIKSSEDCKNLFTMGQQCMMTSLEYMMNSQKKIEEEFRLLKEENSKYRAENEELRAEMKKKNDEIEDLLKFKESIVNITKKST